MEIHLVTAGDVLLQVPLTDRDEPLDGFEHWSDDPVDVALRNDRLDLTFFRRPLPGPRPAIGLTATWDGQDEPVVLAEVRDRTG